MTAPIAGVAKEGVDATEMDALAEKREVDANMTPTISHPLRSWTLFTFGQTILQTSDFLRPTMRRGSEMCEGLDILACMPVGLHVNDEAFGFRNPRIGHSLPLCPG